MGHLVESVGNNQRRPDQPADPLTTAVFLQGLDPSLSQETAAAFSIHLTRVTFLPGEVLMEQDDPGNVMYFILEGTAGVFIRGIADRVKLWKQEM